MSYDPSCYDLASAFLADTPDKNTAANRDELAQHIQTEIEGWIEFILKPAKLDCPCAPAAAKAVLALQSEPVQPAGAREAFHPAQNLPGCMMPDGGDCCAGHAAVVEDWHKQRREIERLRTLPARPEAPLNPKEPGVG